jgi:hypothetical protein
MISYASYNLLHTHTHTHTILPPLPVPSVLGRALRITFIFFIFFPPLQAPSVLGRALRLTFIFFIFFASSASALRLGSRPAAKKEAVRQP